MRNIEVILAAVAVAMAIASIVLGTLGTAPETTMILLGIGLFAISINRFRRKKVVGKINIAQRYNTSVFGANLKGIDRGSRTWKTFKFIWRAGEHFMES